LIIEHLILRLFVRDKQICDRFFSNLSKLTLEKEISLLLRLIHQYYSQYQTHTYISQDELVAFYDLEFPGAKGRPTILSIIQQVYQIETSDSLASDVVKKLIEKDFLNKMVNAALPALSGERSEAIPTIRELLRELEEIKDIEDEAESPFVEDSLDELLAKTETDGLQWRLQCLRESLGPLVGGTLGHVFARPESGKTTFIHSEVSFIAGQLKDGETVLWINNEEAGARVKLRLYCAVCNATLADIISKQDKAKELFNARGGHRIKLYDTASISVSEIERLCREYRPRLVVIDQGDKVTYRGCESAGNGADRLKGVYDNLREVVKRCNDEWKIDMLTVGQADAACEGNKWLQMANLDSGKTGKAGAFDYIIGIGKTYEQNEEGVRFITFCKNKLKGIPGRFIVNIDSQRARYSD
jgi:replicative DNA helicase